MKLIIKQGAIKYAVSELEQLPNPNTKILITSLPFNTELYIGSADINNENSELVDYVEQLPEDFCGDKYIYNDGELELNPAWEAPIEE